MSKKMFLSSVRHRFVFVSAIVMFAFSFVSCTTPGGPRQEIPVQRAKPTLRMAELEHQIHALINKERRKNGLSALSQNDKLSTIARKHSQDMAKRNYFSHGSPEGRDFSYRYSRDGYSCSVQVKNVIYTGAENIFQNTLYDRVVIVNGVKHYDWNTVQEIAESTVQGWMNSPGHRKNILTPYWRSEGIGAAVSSDDKVYITQNFC